SPTLGAGAIPDEEWDELASAYESGILEVAGGCERIVPVAAGQSRESFAGTCVGAPALLDLDGLAPTLADLERRGAFPPVPPGPSDSPPQAPAWWATVVEHTSQMQAAYAAWLD